MIFGKRGVVMLLIQHSASRTVFTIVREAECERNNYNMVISMPLFACKPTLGRYHYQTLWGS